MKDREEISIEATNLYAHLVVKQPQAAVAILLQGPILDVLLDIRELLIEAAYPRGVHDRGKRA